MYIDDGRVLKITVMCSEDRLIPVIGSRRWKQLHQSQSAEQAVSLIISLGVANDPAPETQCFYKAIISFVMPARLFVCPHWTTRLPLDAFFMKFYIAVFFRKSVEKIQASTKSDKNNGVFYINTYVHSW